MDFDQLKMLVDYHYWGRDRVLDCAAALTPEQFTRDMANSFGSVRDTLVHIYGADWLWRERWEGRSHDGLPAANGFPDVASIRAAWADEEERLRAHVERLGPSGVLEPVRYTRNGVSQAQPFWQTLQHVVNHGTYHRGQVVTLLRQLGAPVTAMDLIVFYRQRAAQAT